VIRIIDADMNLNPIQKNSDLLFYGYLHLILQT
jgi:hypothetical protein